MPVNEMKICMLAPEFIPVWGGVGTYILELLLHLPKQYEVHVVTPKRESFGNDKPYQYHEIPNFKSNIKIHYISTANDTFFYNAAFQYECFRQVPRILKNEQIDLIHTHTAHMPDLLLMFRKLKRPIITTVHSTIKTQRVATQFSKKNFSNMERSEQATYLAYPALRFSEEIYYRRKRTFISPSNWMKNWLINSFHINEEIHVIPNSVDLNNYESEDTAIIERQFPDDIFKDKKIILFVGRLLALKGIEVLIEAIPNIVRKYGSRNLLFVFVGPGDRVRYLKMVRSLGVETSCFFTGPVSREVVVYLMKKSLLLVAPSFVENAPYSILESMACGLPVITTNVGGVSEIIRNNYNGKLLETNTSSEIENSITALLDNETLRNRIMKYAIETVKTNFSWSVNLQKYIDVYSNALNNS